MNSCICLLQITNYLHYTLVILDRSLSLSRILSDIEIQQLLAEPKPLSPNWENRLRLTPKAQEAFSQRSLPLQLSNGHEFTLVLRGNRLSPLDFSVILVFKDVDGSDYILRRHNGVHPSTHTNEYEKRLSLPNAELPICFHRHLATERYQRAGLRIDGYAERANDYSDIRTAQEAMIHDAGFVVPPNRAIQLVMLGDN
jgi:hypothetical protein